MPKIIVCSLFANNPNGHIYRDIQHLSDNSNLNLKLVNAGIFNLIPFAGIQNKLIFFGFEERSQLVQAFIAQFIFAKSYIVITNNFSKARIKKVLWLYKYGLFRSHIIVHTQYEYKLISKYGIRDSRITIRPHWMFIDRTLTLSNDKRIYDFLVVGPLKNDKPLFPLEALKVSDKQGMKLLKVNLPENLPFQEKFSVENIAGSFSSEEWNSIFFRSHTVLLHLSEDYEGKLSGIFMDAIACGCEIIVSAIEPYLSISEIFNRKETHGGRYLTFKSNPKTTEEYSLLNVSKFYNEL